MGLPGRYLSAEPLLPFPHCTRDWRRQGRSAFQLGAVQTSAFTKQRGSTLIPGCLRALLGLDPASVYLSRVGQGVQGLTLICPISVAIAANHGSLTEQGSRCLLRRVGAFRQSHRHSLVSAFLSAICYVNALR